MSNELDIHDTCLTCGATTEIGFIIHADDDVAEVEITANGQATLEREFQAYLTLAKQVNANVQYEITPLNADSQQLTARLKFECSAEKLIFELKSRSLAK